jgi:hypothetical protein
VQELVSGADFYSNPRFSKSGDQILWKEWSFPHMPWESSYLYTASFRSRQLGEREKIAGSSDSSVSQPDFVGEHVAFLSDETGFNEPWVWRASDKSKRRLLKETPKHDVGELDWTFANSSWAPLDENNLAVAIGGKILLSSLQHGTQRTIGLSYSSLGFLQAKSSTQIAMIARSSHSSAEVVLVDIETEKVTSLKRASKSTLSNDYISEPSVITYTSFPDPGSEERPEACKTPFDRHKRSLLASQTRYYTSQRTRTSVT